MKPSDFKSIKRGIFRGRHYKIVWRKPIETKANKRKRIENGGYCDAPDTKSKKILLNVRCSPIMILDSTIHEALHACNPDLSELAVTESMNCLMRFLIQMGIKVEFEPDRPLKDKIGDWSPAIC